MKKFIRPLAWLLLAAGLSVALIAAAAYLALKPRQGEWRMPLALGPWRIEASVPTLLRWATHPLLRPQLDARRLTLGGGTVWQLQAGRGDTLVAQCAPCRLRIAALGAQPVQIVQARVRLRVRGADRYDGELQLGGAAQAITLPWHGALNAEGLQLHTELAPTPLAQLVALFGDAVPEARTARIEGTVGVVLDATLGAQGLQLRRIVPRVRGLAVSGLGTEALASADPSARCRPQPARGRIEGWIQNAVIAAEDQRFFEHPGYEPAAWIAAGKGNQRRPEALQGASTITQQLAKLVHTGDARDAARKLREWLYAVEMERTLGKGRILQLYLALLPWGDGICGAEAAARHHLGKPAHLLKPREAAWLASLLVNPDRQLRRWSQDEGAARERVAGVIKGITRLPRERRESELEALASWQPPIARH